MNINKWAKKFVRGILTEYRERYRFWKPGFMVFGSPVITHPDLVIIGFQPGGNKKDFDEYKDKIFKLPNRLVFLDAGRRKPFARNLIDLLNAGGKKLLTKSVYYNLILFRAPNAKRYWCNRNKLCKPKRLEMEEFCFRKAREIVEELKPKKVLLIGFDTYFLVNRERILGATRCIKCHEIKRGKKRRVRLAITANCARRKVFVTSHLSGSWISKKDLLRLQDKFREWISEKK